MINKNSPFDSSLPIFVKLFIGFVFCGVIAVFGFVGFMFYKGITMANDPAAIGNYVGKIKSGYDQAVGDQN